VDRLDAGRAEGARASRDPRYALHSASEDPDAWTGDAKVAGVAEEVGSSDGKSHKFRLDILEASTVELDDERKHLVITVWTPAGGVRVMKR
jgi:hypothetical protein